MGCHSKRWMPAELVYAVGKQELTAGHKGMRYFDNIVQECDVLMRIDHLKNTFNELSGQHVRVTRHMEEFDSKYCVKFEHLVGVLNTGANGLSRHKILKEIPRGSLKQLCKFSALNRDADEAYPVLLQAIQETQEKGDGLFKAIASDKRPCLWLKRFQWNRSCYL